MTQELASANEATKPVNVAECTPNRYFFLQPVTFQVEDELFQIPGILFPASETFLELYPAILEGNTLVVLQDCTKRQFEAFLIIVLQPHSHMFNGKHPCNYPLLLEILLPAFELAKKWGFRQLAQDIGHQAGPLMSSPIQKVAVGHRYAVLPWYRSGLEELVTSDDDITLEDAGEISFPLALRLYHARARYVRGMRDRRHEDNGTVASEIVESMFAEDLAIFPASRSEVIESEDQLHQVEQMDETDTETVIVTAPAVEEDFEVVSQPQEQLVTEIISASESEGAHDATHDAKEPNDSVQQEQPNEGTILSGDHAGSPSAESSCSGTQTVTNTESAETKDETKPDSKSETYTIEAQSSSSAATNVAAHPETNVHASSGANEHKRQIIRAIININGAGRSLAALLPKSADCKKKEQNCGQTKRCVLCCQKKTQEKLGNTKARTALGQTCLKHILNNPGQPSCSSEVLGGVPIRCSAQPALCGAKKRCWSCIAKEVEQLIQRGDMI